MPAQLVGLTESVRILLDKPIVLLGRDVECDIQFESRKISRRHCCLAQIGEQLVVRDLGSTNGIRINGVRVLEGYLRAGDELAVGNHRYLVSWDAMPVGLEGAHPVRKVRDRSGAAGVEQPSPQAIPDPAARGAPVRDDAPIPLADSGLLPEQPSTALGSEPEDPLAGPTPNVLPLLPFGIVPNEIQLAPDTDDEMPALSPRQRELRKQHKPPAKPPSDG